MTAGRALAAAAALVLAACSGAASTGASPVATTTVDLPKSYRFAPPVIAVDTGATVTWTNSDNFTHNVDFADAEPLPMAPGERATRKFDTPGSYAYVCSLHPTDMQGTVVVSGG